MSIIKSPVFLIGSGRSGTTFLANLLGQHPEIALYPGEANELWHPRLYPWHESDIDVAPIWMDPQAFTRRSLKSRPWGWRRTIKKTFAGWYRQQSRPVFLHKTVMTNFMLPEMQKLFPDAKFIHLVRSGLSVALSYQKKELEKYRRPKYHHYINPEDHPRIRACHAEYWKQIIFEVERFRQNEVSEGHFLELRYEDLMAEPDTRLEELLTFIGVGQFPEDQQQELRSRFQDRNYKVRSELGDEEQSRLQQIMQPALEMKGYG